MNKVKLLDADGDLFVICATSMYQYVDDGCEYIEVSNDDWYFIYHCPSVKAREFIQEYFDGYDLDLTDLGCSYIETESGQVQQKINKQSLENSLEDPDRSTIANSNVSWLQIFVSIGFSLVAFAASYWISIQIETIHQSGGKTFSWELLRDLSIITGISYAITSLWFIKKKYKQR